MPNSIGANKVTLSNDKALDIDGVLLLSEIIIYANNDDAIYGRSNESYQSHDDNRESN
jgi:hypothetical protein